ncbi:MAG: anti-sigma F factor [Clostridium sp.]|nr:anti-sigma F factor [Clostridium sp.]
MKKNIALKNEMEITFDALSENESFARVAVAAFVAPLNPTMEEISDIKTAVSEAVTNAIIHGYDVDFMRKNQREETGKVHMRCLIEEDVLSVEIRDTGKGIEDIDRAMEPLFTTKPEMDRSGMGFAFMEAFMDDLEVVSKPGCGTVVLMKKKLGVTSWVEREE